MEPADPQPACNSQKEATIPQSTLVLDYRPGSADTFQWPRLFRSLYAAIFVGVLAAIGITLNHRFYSLGEYLVLFIYPGGLWYVGARMVESKSSLPTKIVKLIAGLSATAFMPFAIFDRNGASVLMYAEAYGWGCEELFGGAKFQIITICAIVFAIADVIDCIIWLRQKKVTPPRCVSI